MSKRKILKKVLAHNIIKLKKKTPVRTNAIHRKFINPQSSMQQSEEH